MLLFGFCLDLRHENVRDTGIALMKDTSTMQAPTMDAESQPVWQGPVE